MMMRPIPASMPWMTDRGKNPVSLPALAKPSRIWMPPATTPTARAPAKPSSVTAPKTMTIMPAAGPLIVTYEPDSRLATVPATMPEMMPAIGGAPEANAMPRHSGSAMRKRMKPETTSYLAFSRSPGSQSLGGTGRPCAGGVVGCGVIGSSVVIALLLSVLRDASAFGWEPPSRCCGWEEFS